MILSGCTQFTLLSNFFTSSPDQANNTDLWDEFSDDKSGWDEFNYDEGSAKYINDGYQIMVNQRNTDIFSIFPRNYVDSEIRVTASKIEGIDNNNYGIICRFQDLENFYAGQISSDGYAGIFKVEKNIYQLLGHKVMIPAPIVLGGNAENVIQFKCTENKLTLSVNGELVDSQEDETFKTGENGLIAGNIDGDYGVFRFDDFSMVVW